MTETDDSREQGVEFGSLADDLDDASYPLTKEELLDRWGDREVELKSGERTLRAILDPMGEMEFDGADDVRQTVVGMVGDEGLERENYSDRGGQAGDDAEGQESV